MASAASSSFLVGLVSVDAALALPAAPASPDAAFAETGVAE